MNPDWLLDLLPKIDKKLNTEKHDQVNMDSAYSWKLEELINQTSSSFKQLQSILSQLNGVLTSRILPSTLLELAMIKLCSKLESLTPTSTAHFPVKSDTVSETSLLEQVVTESEASNTGTDAVSSETKSTSNVKKSKKKKKLTANKIQSKVNVKK